MNTIKVTNIAELKNRKGNTDTTVEVLGYYTSGDQGGGTFYWNNTSTATDNGGTIISVTGITTGRWMRNYNNEISVKWFGAKGDGITDDTSAFISFLTIVSGKSGFIPNPSIGYLISSSLTIAQNTRIFGENKFTTRLFPNSNFTFINLKNGAVLENLFIDGNQQTGIGISMTGVDGSQRIDNCKIANWQNTCIYFDATAGSYFSSSCCLVYRTTAPNVAATFGSGLYAVVIQNVVNLSAVPRRFYGFESGGTPSFSFGGANDATITNSWLGDLLYSVNTAGCLISNSRIGTTQPFTIFGGQNSIVGCDVFPIITLGTGAGGCSIVGCALNSGAPIDNSNNATNLLSHFDTSYTPIITSTGTTPVLGNGSIIGQYNRQGNIVTVYCQLTIGSTTTLGTGILRISLPANTPVVNVQAQVCGNIRASHDGILYFGSVLVPGSAAGQYAEFQRDTVNGFTFNTPVIWSTGDIFYIQFSYRI